MTAVKEICSRFGLSNPVVGDRDAAGDRPVVVDYPAAGGAFNLYACEDHLSDILGPVKITFREDGRAA